MHAISLISLGMKYGAFILLIHLTAISWAQNPVKLPRKLCGNFTGIQPSYAFTHHGEAFTMDSIAVSVVLRKTEGTVCYVNPSHCMVTKGAYQSVLKVKDDKTTKWVIVMWEQAGAIPEELWVFPKSKTMVRTGVFPQPNVKLKKLRKE